MKPVTIRCIYEQEGDSCQEGDLPQTLQVETDNAGEGHYIVIQTTRWAIDADGIDAFAEMLRGLLAQVEGAA